MPKNKAWKFLASIQFAVIIIGVLLITLVIGTVVNQQKAADYLYHAWWFIGLLGLFCLNLLICTLDRFRLSFNFLGVLLSHIGILIIAIGVIIGNISGEKGYLGLDQGASSDGFQQVDGKEMKLPFTVRLDKFEVERYPPRLYVALPDGSLKDSFIPKEDEKHKIDSGVNIKINKIFSDYLKKDEVIKESDELKKPAIEIELIGKDEKSITKQWLLSEENGKNSFLVNRSSLMVLYKYPDPKVDINKELNDEKSPHFEKLFVIMNKTGESKGFPVEIGKEFRIDSEYTIKIEEYTPDFRMRGHKEMDVPPSNPALYTVISGTQGTEKRWVFSNFPDFGEMHKVKYSDIKLLYHRPREGSYQNLVKILETPDGNRMVAFVKAEKLIQTAPLSVGGEFVLDDMGIKIKLLSFIPNAHLKTEESNASSEPKNRAVKLTVTGDKGKETVTLKEKDEGLTPIRNYRFFLKYQQDPNDIKDYKSTLTILKDNQDVLNKVIEVNYPLSFEGYRFYQSGWKQERPGWSNFQVAKDPGIPIVYLGFAITMLGMIFACFLRFKKA